MFHRYQRSETGSHQRCCTSYQWPLQAHMLKTWSPSQDPWGRKLFIQWAFEELLGSFLSWVAGVLPLAAMGCGIPSIPLVHCFSVTRRRTCLCPCCCPTPSPKQRGKPARAEVSEHTEFSHNLNTVQVFLVS